MTLGMIAVGCVLAPQIVSEGKQNGVFEYQRTLPVSRSIILLADLIIWGIASLPGVIMGCVASVLRFNINLNINSTKLFGYSTYTVYNDLHWILYCLLASTEYHGIGNTGNYDRRVTFFAYNISSGKTSRVVYVYL